MLASPSYLATTTTEAAQEAAPQLPAAPPLERHEQLLRLVGGHGEEGDHPLTLDGVGAHECPLLLEGGQEHSLRLEAARVALDMKMRAV